jgi:hypothetical protein
MRTSDKTSESYQSGKVKQADSGNPSFLSRRDLLQAMGASLAGASMLIARPPLPIQASAQGRTSLPIANNLEGFVAEFARITRAAGKIFGVMLHRDDKWPLDLEEEARRWTLLAKYKPTIIARYPYTHMDPNNEHYSKAGKNLFDTNLARYRNVAVMKERTRLMQKPMRNIHFQPNNSGQEEGGWL